MSYKLVYSDNFLKKAKKLIKKNPPIKNKVYKTFELLENNPFHPSLRLHKLKGNLKDYYSISIDMSYRIIIDFVIKDNEIILLDIGTHDDVY
jgi:addiction module RelE/StbE family toxin